MADENNIPLEISADTKQAQDSMAKLADVIEKSVLGINKSIDGNLNNGVKEVQKNTEKSAKSVTSFFNTLKGAAVAAIGVFAAREIAGFFSELISAGAQYEKEVQGLNVALASTGEFSKEASDSIQDFASEIQATTALAGGAVVEAFSLAKTFGITNDQAKKLTKSAIELSAATGVDLNTAVEQLGGTLSGSAGRLAKLGPEFKNLTEDQLKAGAAIEIVNKRFNGFSQDLAKTFGGAVAQAKNSFDDVIEALGRSITQNPVVIASINAISKAFAGLTNFLDNNREGITEFIGSAIKFTLSFVGPVLDGIKILLKGFSELTKILFSVLDIFINVVDFMKKVFEPVIRNVVSAVVGSLKAVGAVLAASVEGLVRLANVVPGVSDTFKKFGINLDEVQGAMKILTDETIGSLADSNDEVADSVLKASDSFTKFVKEGLVSTSNGLDKAVTGFDGLSESVKSTVNDVLAVDVTFKDTTSSIKNQTKATEKLAEANDAVKGSFDKLKGDLENITKEIDKQTKSAKELIDIEFDRGEQLAKNAEIELKQQGKLSGEVVDVIANYRKAQKAKRDLALEALSIADFTLGELASSIGDQLTSFKEGIISAGKSVSDLFGGKSFDFGGAASSLADAGKSMTKGLVESLKKVKFGDVLSGVKSVIVGAFEIGKNVLSGAFVNQFTDVIKAFGDFPNAITSSFENLDKTVGDLLDALPTVISKLIDNLPAIGDKVAAALGPLFKQLADRLPDIIRALFRAIGPIIKSIFEDVIPTLIRALPDLFRGILAALPGIIKTILGALPTIIKELFLALPEIVRALADALPDIVIAIVEALPDIALAFVEGVIGSAGQIVESLIDALLINGGLERIIVAIIKAIPRVALALVQGFLRGMVTAGEALGSAFVRAVQAASSNIGKNIASGFKNNILGISNFFGSLANGFRSVIIDGFVQGAAQIPARMSEAFTNGIAQLYGAFGSFFSGLYSTLIGGGQQIFGSLISAFSNIGGFFADSISKLRDAITEPFKPIIDFFSNFEIKIPGVSGGGGGGFISQAAGKVGKAIGLASGGVVPDGFPNDTFPARLTSKEMVLPPDIATGLLGLIRSGSMAPQSSPTDDVQIALLNKIANLLSNPVSVSTTANVNGKALADIILQLNRNNARLTA